MNTPASKFKPMNADCNATLITAGAAVLTHPATRHPLAGDFYSVSARRGRTWIQIHGETRSSLGSLIAWTYLLDNPTVTAKRFTQAIHVHVEGTLDGIPVEIFTGYDSSNSSIGRTLAARTDWHTDKVTVPVHHLRAVQVGAYRTAVAA